MRSLRVAVDAGNLVRDRRGLGRIARATLAIASRDAETSVSLLADSAADRAALASEFTNLEVERARSATVRDRFDVVWYPFNGMRFGAAAPSVVTIADAFAFTEPHREFVARMREQAPIRRAARDATRIVTISTWSQAEIERALPRSVGKVTTIPLVADPYWQPDHTDPLPATLVGVPYALVVGVRETRKNARLALDGFERAARDRPNERLVIVGELSAADRAYARDIGVRTIVLTPDDATLRALYTHATAVLVPSLAEGFGLVAAEALACGAPLIAANTSALPEASRGCGILLNPHDHVAWARAIRTLFDDPARAARLRSQARGAYANVDRDAPARTLVALLRASAGI